MGVSIALVLYSLAGGEITRSSFFFGVVAFKSPELILYLMNASLFYFLWRYWLHSKRIISCQELSRNGNPTYTDERNYLCNFQFELASNESYVNISKALFESKGHNGINQYSPLLVRGIFKRKLDYSFLSATVGNNGLISDKPEILIPYFKIFFIEIIAQVKAVFKHAAFSDYVLPYWVALLPILIWIYQFIYMAREIAN